MKHFTEQQVDDLIKLKWGRLVDSPHQYAYATDATLGKIFGVSGSQIRRLYTRRFEAEKERQRPLIKLSIDNYQL